MAADAGTIAQQGPWLESALVAVAAGAALSALRQPEPRADSLPSGVLAAWLATAPAASLDGWLVASLQHAPTAKALTATQTLDLLTACLRHPRSWNAATAPAAIEGRGRGSRLPLSVRVGGADAKHRRWRTLTPLHRLHAHPAAAARWLIDTVVTELGSEPDVGRRQLAEQRLTVVLIVTEGSPPLLDAVRRHLRACLASAAWRPHAASALHTVTALWRELEPGSRGWVGWSARPTVTDTPVTVRSSRAARFG